LDAIDKQLPQNMDAERAVLGAILLDGNTPNAALCKASAEVRAEDFFLEAHLRIFRAFVEMSKASLVIDLVTLKNRLESTSELDLAGGAAYISQLIDGVPRLANVPYYARIVREKSQLRRLVHFSRTLQDGALAPSAQIGELEGKLREALSYISENSTSALLLVSAGELLKADLKPREMILSPILPTQSLAMIYSARGTGKTFFSLSIAIAVATGNKFLNWEAPKARRVLYIDGELPATTLRDRIASLKGNVEKNKDKPLCDEMLQLLTPDFQTMPMPDLTTLEGQAQIEPLLRGVELVIVDNLSALCRTGKENEGESWLPVQAWALRLRQRGISVLFIHHAGKGGAQRGTSRREDLLDLVIVLKHPEDYSADEGLRCEVRFEKCRSLIGEDANAFEVCLESNSPNELEWTVSDVDNTFITRVAELLKSGRSVREVAKELAISKSKVHRIKSKLGIVQNG
jgi:AAA domain-containing protein/DnaB helicase-like protein